MNKTSHTDEPYEGELDGFNQSPRHLSADLTTRQDFNGNVNDRQLRAGHKNNLSDLASRDTSGGNLDPEPGPPDRSPFGLADGKSSQSTHPVSQLEAGAAAPATPAISLPSHSTSQSPQVPGEDDNPDKKRLPAVVQKTADKIRNFASFVGPGFLIAVAYIDPGNYSTGIAAGATYQYKLLFVVLLANLFAIFLQTLCIKLGTVSGLNLAQACRQFLPRWLSYVLYFFAEVAIIATDIAEVIGFAIGLNLLIPEVPLVAGCAISVLDVMLILFFYRPDGPMNGLRIFEYMISFLVLAVVVCFCIQLSLIDGGTSVRSIFRGYVPSSALTEQQGLYQACGILGATVMPHSLYLGSGIVQPRLREYDRRHDLLGPSSARARRNNSTTSSLASADNNDDDFDPSNPDKSYYVPSLAAIRHSYRVSALELALALFTFALFVNSSIVIISGASLYPETSEDQADIFALHALLSDSISPAAGIVFALALLLSGVSAGVVCTISGQMVCEGSLNWRMRPWLRRLVTRSISIVPSVVIAGAVGREGLDAALNASQVVLSIVLPFVTAPLIWFTCRKRYMTVRTTAAAAGCGHQGSAGGGGAFSVARGSGTGDNGFEEDAEGNREERPVSMANSWYTAIFAVLLWLVIAVLNVANLVLLGTAS